MRVRCPHCDDLTTIRKSIQLSEQCREITCHCNNSLCGHVFACHITPVRTLSLSACPNRLINLPLSEHINRKQLVLQLDQPSKGIKHAIARNARPA